jgi:hypothetical protein
VNPVINKWCTVNAIITDPTPSIPLLWVEKVVLGVGTKVRIVVFYLHLNCIYKFEMRYMLAYFYGQLFMIIICQSPEYLLSFQWRMEWK